MLHRWLQDYFAGMAALCETDINKCIPKPVPLPAENAAPAISRCNHGIRWDRWFPTNWAAHAD